MAIGFIIIAVFVMNIAPVTAAVVDESSLDTVVDEVDEVVEVGVDTEVVSEVDVEDDIQIGNVDLTEEEVQELYQYNRSLELGNGVTTLSASRAVRGWWAAIPTKYSGVVQVGPGCTVPGATQYYTKLLQACLNILGYNAGSEDGIYGTNTKNAIMRFQRAHSWLTVDGIAGENTWRAIDIRMDSLLPTKVSF